MHKTVHCEIVLWCTEWRMRSQSDIQSGTLSNVDHYKASRTKHRRQLLTCNSRIMSPTSVTCSWYNFLYHWFFWELNKLLASNKRTCDKIKDAMHSYYTMWPYQHLQVFEVLSTHLWSWLHVQTQARFPIYDNFLFDNIYASQPITMHTNRHRLFYNRYKCSFICYAYWYFLALA